MSLCIPQSLRHLPEAGDTTELSAFNDCVCKTQSPFEQSSNDSYSYTAYGETGDAPGIDPTYPDPGPLGYNGTVQCGVFKPTNVISLSYGGQEADVPIAYQKRQCNEYLKLGLQGVSFMFASGDSGVSSKLILYHGRAAGLKFPDYPYPYGFDGPTGCLGPELDIFNPTWPSESIATKLYRKCNGG